MKRAVLGLAWFVGALALPSCGGSSSSSKASCTGNTACGGDVVGTWQAETVCSSTGSGASNPFGSFCPSATFSTSGVTISGTFTFKADMTYSTALVEGGSAGFTIPSSCLTMNGITLSCTQLAQATSAAGSAGSGGSANLFSGLTCQTSGTNCVCNFTLQSQAVNESGTYSVTGTDLNLKPTGGAASSGAFCVSGNELHMSSLSTSMSMNMGSMGSMGVSVEIVAVKQ